jgi:hypothetical protein
MQLGATKSLTSEKEQDMTTLMWRVFICAAMVLSACGLARADERDNGCSLKTLRGTYVFSATGFNIVAGVAQPKAIVEVIDFNGDGTLSVPAATLSANGVIIRSLPGGFGTYTIEDDCSGTITFNGPTFDTFISRDGDTILMIQTNPNTVFQGTARRRSREHGRG